MSFRLGLGFVGCLLLTSCGSALSSGDLLGGDGGDNTPDSGHVTSPDGGGHVDASSMGGGGKDSGSSGKDATAKDAPTGTGTGSGTGSGTGDDAGDDAGDDSGADAGDDSGGDDSGADASCTPQSCQDQGIECGDADDGCGGALHCGGCGNNETCDMGQCTCAPQSCSDQGFNCGTADDGCGNTLHCGTCPTSNGQCKQNVCTGSCMPKTCAELGFNCGTNGNGCGGTVSCGTCATGKLCIAGSCTL